jgi:hybrid cluster-associated redox disulfide protein
MDMITEDMTIQEIFLNFPDQKDELAHVLMEAGLGCVGCAASSFETLKEGLMAHGMSEEDLQKIVSDLNSIIKE